MSFPNKRLRRLRKTPALRRLVAETRLSVDDLVAPLFVREGIDDPVSIPSLTGVQQHTRESLVKEVRELQSLGVPGIILFGIPEQKDPLGSEAWNPDGIVLELLWNYFFSAMYKICVQFWKPTHVLRGLPLSTY